MDVFFYFYSFSEQRNTENLINAIETKMDSGSFINWNDSLHA